MVKSAFAAAAAVAAVAGLALTPVAASAATTRHPAILARSATSGSDPSTVTTVTFTVTTTGTLAITAPDTVDLGTGGVGTTISGVLSGGGTTPVPTVVTDNRALDAASWTVTASSTNWSLNAGGGAPNETIPASDVTYTPGTIVKAGTITIGGPAFATLLTPVFPATVGAPVTVVTGTAGVGDNSATWDPTIAVAVPASVVAGGYTGTLTQSVA